MLQFSLQRKSFGPTLFWYVKHLNKTPKQSVKNKYLIKLQEIVVHERFCNMRRQHGFSLESRLLLPSPTAPNGAAWKSNGTVAIKRRK